MTTELPVIAAWCGCAKCEAGSSEFYDLPGGCSNCGARFIVRSRKGDRRPLSVECPDCEVTVYSWARVTVQVIR